MENWCDDMTHVASDVALFVDASIVDQRLLHMTATSEDIQRKAYDLCSRAQELLLQIEHSGEYQTVANSYLLVVNFLFIWISCSCQIRLRHVEAFSIKSSISFSWY